MRRYVLKKGDKSTAGGVVLEGLTGYIHHGTESTFVGAKINCPACKSTGLIVAKGPRWPNTYHDENGDKEEALSDDVCLCKCEPPPIMLASQYDTYHTFSAPALESMGFRSAGAPLASEKNSDTASSFSENTASICHNMTDAEFYATMNQLRDKAIGLINARIAELARWHSSDQNKVNVWFGSPTETTRQLLSDGLSRMRTIMQSLSDRNYEKQTPENLARVGCVPRSGGNIAAASVCKPDGTYTIFIGATFCEMETERNRYDGVPLDGDSKLLTLIHEVSHFPAAMDTEDRWYSTRQSRSHAAARDTFCVSNADNIAGYVINMPKWTERGDATWK